MASSTRDDEDLERDDEIRLWREGDLWVITDMETGVTTQGETREEALEMLDEAVALTKEARADADEAPEPDAPWFDS